MPDPNNPGQFGNREDTVRQARKGGKASGGKFKPGDKRTIEAAKKGAANEPHEARVRGGENSHN